MRGTVLFIMPRLPFPPSSGRKNSLYHYCKILSKELEFRLVVAGFLESGDDPEEKPDFIDRLVVLPSAGAVEKIVAVTKDSIILKRKPMQVSLYWSPKAKRIVDKLIEEEKPDYIIGDMVRSTEYIKDAKAYRIADLDDRISLRYQRQLETDIDGINPYGAFINTVPQIIQKLMLRRPLKVFVVKNEIALLRKYELEIGYKCEKTIFVAAKEAKEFNIELRENRASAVPIGVDTEYFSYSATGKVGNVIGFLGAMNVAHNENAVKHFVADILPRILKKVPDTKILVIGGGASADLLKLASEHVIFTGRVEDVREYLEKCKVFVCPMQFGSGIKTKNLEAMSMGLPVVTTSIGAENIGALNGVEWLVKDSDLDFANAVVSLLKSDEKRRKLGGAARQFVKDNFTWEIAKKSWEHIFSQIEEKQ